MQLSGVNTYLKAHIHAHIYTYTKMIWIYQNQNNLNWRIISIKLPWFMFSGQFSWCFVCMSPNENLTWNEFCNSRSLFQLELFVKLICLKHEFIQDKKQFKKISITTLSLRLALKILREWITSTVIQTTWGCF